MTTPLTRLRRLRAIAPLARAVGAADDAGTLTGHLLRRLYREQDRAAQAGCRVSDIVDIVLDGLDEGRSTEQTTT